jgi:hypothetical protein
MKSLPRNLVYVLVGWAAVGITLATLAQAANEATVAAAPPGSNGNMPIAPRPQQLPPTVSATGRAATSPANTDSRGIFLSLDRAHRGYLDKSDVTSHQYLSSHFGTCDINGDGRLSEDEVQGCINRNAQPDK